MQAFIVALIVLMVGFCLVLWVQATSRWSQGKPLVAAEPPGDVKWDGIDILAAIMLMIGATAFAQLILRDTFGLKFPASLVTLEPDQRVLLVTATASANLIAFLVSLSFVIARTGTRISDLGYSIKRIGYDCWLGIRFFVMIAPPLYLIQFVLHHWFPTEHPYIQIIRENPDPRLFWAAGFSAVIVAPIVEEYGFRGLLQGWCQKLARQVTGLSAENTRTADNAASTSIVENDDEAKSPTDALNPYASTSSLADASTNAKHGMAGTLDSKNTSGPFWPILVSSILFALAHYSHGPDPIPLFFFALGLGYLYRQTNRLIACMTVHFCLNALTMLALFVSVYYDA